MQLSIFDALAAVQTPPVVDAVERWDWYPSPIKLVSLHQPWASLVVECLKLWETRPATISWRNYRGPIAIHAAKSIDWDVVAEIQREFGDLGLDWENLPLGAIVGVAQITACVVMTPELIAQQTSLERAVGNWEAGRLAIRLERAVKLPEAVFCRGMQGVVGMSADTEAEVRRSLGLPVLRSTPEKPAEQELDGKGIVPLASQNPELEAIAVDAEYEEPVEVFQVSQTDLETLGELNSCLTLTENRVKALVSWGGREWVVTGRCVRGPTTLEVNAREVVERSRWPWDVYSYSTLPRSEGGGFANGYAGQLVKHRKRELVLTAAEAQFVLQEAAAPEPAPEAKPKRAIRQPPPPKAPSEWKHLGRPQEPSLCGLHNVSYYLLGTLTAWQLEGWRSRLCPECLKIWEKPEARDEPEPETELLSCPISPTATVRLWMRIGDEFRDMGCSSMVDRARRDLDPALWWFPVADDGTPIHPGKPRRLS